MRKLYTPETAAADVTQCLQVLEGRWKLIILFHLFDGKVQRYSDFEKLIPDISQKMLAQQLGKLAAPQLVELNRRLAAAEADPDVGSSWADVLDLAKADRRQQG